MRAPHRTPLRTGAAPARRVTGDLRPPPVGWRTPERKHGGLARQAESIAGGRTCPRSSKARSRWMSVILSRTGSRTWRPRRPRGRRTSCSIAWDDVGFGTMDVLRRAGSHADDDQDRGHGGASTRNFHTTALCSPTRASLLTGRNATSNGMATIAEFSSGFPGISTRIPFENGFISEVLVEHGYNTYCVGKWHLTPGEETGMAAWKKRWPLGRGFERFYGFLGGESSCWYPDLVHDNHPIDPPATPEEGYHIAEGPVRPGDPVHPRCEGRRSGQAVLHVLLARRRACPAPRVRGVGRQVQGRLRRAATRRSATGILARQKELGLLPADTELSAINPHGEPGATGPDGQPWPTARHGSAVGHAGR